MVTYGAKGTPPHSQRHFTNVHGIAHPLAFVAAHPFGPVIRRIKPDFDSGTGQFFFPSSRFRGPERLPYSILRLRYFLFHLSFSPFLLTLYANSNLTCFGAGPKVSIQIAFSQA
jgi:hypothetical protein